MEVGNYEGKDIETAIQKGLAEQHVTRDDVHVKILQEPRRGFLGLGERAAIVSLIPKDIVSDAAEKVAVEQPIADITDEKVVTETTDTSIEAPNAEVTSQTDVQTEETMDTASEAIGQPATETYDVDMVAQYIIDVLYQYGVPDVRVDVRDEEDKIVYQIMTDKPGLVIGKHGKIINALEVLAQVLTHRYVRSGAYVTLDVDDYRERRYAILEKLAKRVENEVMTDHEPVYLDPLPAGERKIVHNLLAQYPEIKTHSEGREPYRYLVATYQARTSE